MPGIIALRFNVPRTRPHNTSALCMWVAGQDTKGPGRCEESTDRQEKSPQTCPVVARTPTGGFRSGQMLGPGKRDGKSGKTQVSVRMFISWEFYED